MARNKKKSGFSPENVGAGLDDMLDPIHPEAEPDNSNESVKDQILDSNSEDEKLTQELQQTPDTLPEEVTDDDTIPKSSTSLGDILNNNDSYDKKQTLVYLSKETRNILESLGKFVGKKNGGKSFVVEDALKKYFDMNKDYVDEAVKKHGRKSR